MLVDSHCHLDRLDYDARHKDLTDVINKAQAQGVNYFLSVCVTLEDYPSMAQLISGHKNIFSTCGVHPLYPGDELDEALLLEYASANNVVAIGETGLDFFYSPETKEWQIDTFRKQIRVAIKLNKPLIIHTRDARQETLSILKEEGAEKVGGVLHCFTESLAMAEEAMKMGFYISVSGIATFKNATELQEVIRAIPLNRLLVETDSPYLAPVPHRGKQNEPAFTRDVAKFVANLKHVSLEELAKITTQNFFSLFKGAYK
ncbi:deoxyribonuclease of TatD family protein [Psychromonas sp. CNPT3]|uniref:TatD family hydrolase n=1 Tax=Psychromonas sp. CNPT3 TaxID=314282 RepID=UPI00006E808A|nr:YchF/TatD family DNA exonuclease [Psychromonas sp. CNPT3]AGH80765.1 deoxyribonuclease of TatD family protein [Psychromonas sp. CNPT3]